MVSESTREEASTQDLDFNEEMKERAFSNRACCFFIPCFGSKYQSTTTWERIESTVEKQETTWWARSVRALKKVRQWSELVAGPKWKTFIRRFNKNRVRQQGKFQYDPLSYALNFDEGQWQNRNLDVDGVCRDFSSRYASIPGSAKSSMDLGKDGPSFT